MTANKFNGCGDHGTVPARDGNPERKKWDPWCLKCNPVSGKSGLTAGQRVARATDREKEKERKKRAAGR